MERDRRGRRRQPNQERGLRPLHPLLPTQWTSKALRVAMSRDDWSHFEALVLRVASQAPTQARAHGMVIAGLLELDGDRDRDRTGTSPPPLPSGSSGPLDWLDWERQKTLRLLCSAV